MQSSYSLISNMPLVKREQDYLQRLRLKQQRELQQIVDYEKQLRLKQEHNENKLNKQNDKYEKIRQMRIEKKTELDLKQRMRHDNFMRILDNDKGIQKDRMMIVLETNNRIEERHQNTFSMYKSKQEEFMRRQKSSHQDMITSVVQTNKKMLTDKSELIEQKIKAKQDLADKVIQEKQSDLMSKVRNDHYKRDEQNLLVRKTQLDNMENAKKKGNHFDEKLKKIDMALQEKKSIQKQKLQQRSEAELQKKTMQQQFESEILRIQRKQMLS